MSKKKQNKAREQLIEMYINSLEEGEIPWRKGWNDSIDAPQNPVTKTKYHGVNLLMLAYVSRKNGYKDPRWCTLKQANERGWSIIKGSHGTPVEYWMPYDKEERKYLTWKQYQDKMEEARKNGKGLDTIVLYSKISYAFNAEQIQGIPEYVRETNATIETSPFVENLIQNLNVNYMEAGNQAYYVPTEDMVVIPDRTTFHSDYEYNSTRLHELCHATGHESRLKRSLDNVFGSVDYAKEELRVEIASSFIGQTIHLEVSDANLDNHKAYIQNWIDVLNKEPDELFKAIKDAQEIEKYVLEIGEWDRFLDMSRNGYSVLQQMQKDISFCDSVLRIPEKIHDLLKCGAMDEEVLSIIQCNEPMYHQQITENIVHLLEMGEYQDVLNGTEENCKKMIYALDNLYVKSIEETLGFEDYIEQEEGQSI